MPSNPSQTPNTVSFANIMRGANKRRDADDDGDGDNTNSEEVATRMAVAGTGEYRVEDDMSGPDVDDDNTAEDNDGDANYYAYDDEEDGQPRRVAAPLPAATILPQGDAEAEGNVADNNNADDGDDANRHHDNSNFTDGDNAIAAEVDDTSAIGLVADVDDIEDEAHALPAASSSATNSAAPSAPSGLAWLLNLGGSNGDERRNNNTMDTKNNNNTLEDKKGKQGQEEAVEEDTPQPQPPSSSNNNNKTTTNTTVLASVLSFLPSSDILLGAKYASKAFHAQCRIELKGRLVRCMYAPPVRPLATEQQMLLTKPFHMLTAAEQESLLAGSGGAVSSSPLRRPNSPSSQEQQQKRHPLQKNALNVETPALLQAPNAARILATIRGDVFVLSDCVVVRYDRELLETSAWSTFILSAPNLLPSRTADVPSYFICDPSSAKKGFLVDGIMAGPVCQLLLPPTERGGDEDEDVGGGDAASVGGNRGKKPNVSTLSEVNARRRWHNQSERLAEAEDEANALMPVKKSKSRRSRKDAAGDSGASCIVRRGLKTAKIVGQFYVGARQGIKGDSIELGPLPLLYRGTAQLAVDQPYHYTALATGTLIKAQNTVNLALNGRYLSTLAPKAHTHAELSFGDSIIVSRRIQLASPPQPSDPSARVDAQADGAAAAELLPSYKIVYRQVTQGCLYVETHAYATSSPLVGGRKVATTRTLLSAYVKAMGGGSDGNGASPTNTMLVAHHAAASVPPPCSFSYTAGEVSTVCSTILKASDKVTVLGFAPVPQIPLPMSGAVFSASDRGLQAHLKDLVNSAVSPPQPLAYLEGGGGGRGAAGDGEEGFFNNNQTRSSLAPLSRAIAPPTSLAMLVKLAACFSEGSPDMCPPTAWSFPIAVYIDGFTAPTLFLPPTALSTPVAELRRMIVEATRVTPNSTSDINNTTKVLPPVVNTTAADASSSYSSSWLPIGASFHFNVYGNAALRALHEIHKGGGGSGGGTRAGGRSAPSSPSAAVNPNLNVTTASSWVSTRSAAGYSAPTATLTLPMLYESTGIPIAMSSSPLSGANVDYIDAEDALREAAWVHVPQRTQPFAVSLIDLLPYTRDGAFSSDFLSENPSLLQSKGAVGGGWSQGVSGITDRVLAIIISPSVTHENNFNQQLQVGLGAVTPPSTMMAAGAAAAADASEVMGLSAVDRARSLRQGNANAATTDSPRSFYNNGTSKSVAAIAAPPTSSSVSTSLAASTSPPSLSPPIIGQQSLSRYMAAYQLAADCCRLGDSQTLAALFDWTNSGGGNSSAALIAIAQQQQQAANSAANGGGGVAASFKLKSFRSFMAANNFSNNNNNQQQGANGGANTSAADRFFLNVNDRGAVGVSLLHIACEYGKKDVIQLLLSLGASIFLANSSGKLPIHICAEKGHAECLPLLLRGSFSWTASEALQTLFAQDHAGRTPLHLCLQMRYSNTALWLVEQGADVATISDVRGDTAADLACRNHLTVADLCRAGDHKGAVLSLLAGTLDASQYAAELKASNPTITHQALEQQLSAFYVEVLKHKLTDGRLIADVFGKVTVHPKTGRLIENVSGNTALHEAVLRGQTAVVHALLFHPLLAHYIDLFAENSNGDTILHLAASCGSHELVQMILTAASRMAPARYGGVASSGNPSSAKKTTSPPATVVVDTAVTDQRGEQEVVRPRRRSMFDTSSSRRNKGGDNLPPRRKSSVSRPLADDNDDDADDADYTFAPMPSVHHHQQQHGGGADGMNNDRSQQQEPLTPEQQLQLSYDALALTDVFDLLQWRNRKGQSVAHLLFKRRGANMQHTVRWLLQWICGGCGCESYAAAAAGDDADDEHHHASSQQQHQHLTRFARKLLTRIPDANGLTVCHYAIDALLRPSSVYASSTDTVGHATDASQHGSDGGDAQSPFQQQQQHATHPSSSDDGVAFSPEETFVQELILFALPATVPFAMPSVPVEEERALCDAILGENASAGGGATSATSSPRGDNAEEEVEASDEDDGDDDDDDSLQQVIELAPTYTSFSPLQVAFEQRFGARIAQWEKAKRRRKLSAQQQRQRGQGDANEEGMYSDAASNDGQSENSHSNASPSLVSSPPPPPTILESLLRRGSPQLLQWFMTTMRTCVTLAIVTFVQTHEKKERRRERRCRRFLQAQQAAKRAGADRDVDNDGETTPRPSRIIIPSAAEREEETLSHKRMITPSMVRTAVNSKWPINIFGLTSLASTPSSMAAPSSLSSSGSSRGHVSHIGLRNLLLLAIHTDCDAKVKILCDAVCHADAFSLDSTTADRVAREEDSVENKSEDIPTAHRAGLFIANELLRPSLEIAARESLAPNRGESGPIDTTADPKVLSDALSALLLRARSTDAIEAILEAYGPAAVVRAVGAAKIEGGGDAGGGEASLSSFPSLLAVLVDSHSELSNALEASVTRHVPHLPSKQHRPGYVYAAPQFKPSVSGASPTVTLSNPSYTQRLGEMPGVGEGPKDALSEAIKEIKKDGGNNNTTTTAVDVGISMISLATAVQPIGGGQLAFSSSLYSKKVALLKERAEAHYAYRIALLQYAVSRVSSIVVAATEAKQGLAAEAERRLALINAAASSSGYLFDPFANNATATTNVSRSGVRTMNPLHFSDPNSSSNDDATAALPQQQQQPSPAEVKAMRRAAVFVNDYTLSSLMEAAVLAMVSPSVSRTTNLPFSYTEALYGTTSAAVGGSSSSPHRQQPSSPSSSSKPSPCSPAGGQQAANNAILLSTAQVFGDATDGSITFTGCYEPLWEALCQVATSVPTTTIVWTPAMTNILLSPSSCSGGLVDLFASSSPVSRNCLRGGNSFRNNKFYPRRGGGGGGSNMTGGGRKRSSSAGSRKRSSVGGSDGMCGSGSWVPINRSAQHAAKVKERFLDLLPFIRIGNDSSSALLRALFTLRWLNEASLALQWFTSVEYTLRADVSYAASQGVEAAIRAGFEDMLMYHRDYNGEEEENASSSDTLQGLVPEDSNVTAAVSSYTVRATPLPPSPPPYLRWSDDGDAADPYEMPLLHRAALYGHCELIAALLTTGQFGVNDVALFRPSYRACNTNTSTHTQRVNHRGGSSGGFFFNSPSSCSSSSSPFLSRNVTFYEQPLLITPLHAAVYGCHPSAVSLLMAVGADPTRLAKGLVDTDHRYRLTSEGIAAADDDIVAGEDSDDDYHQPPPSAPHLSVLHMAAFNGDEPSLALLLDHPAIRNALPSSSTVRMTDSGVVNLTPMIPLIEEDPKEKAQRLKKKSKEAAGGGGEGGYVDEDMPSIPRGVGMLRSPLHYSCAVGSRGCALQLLRAGASLADADINGDSPIMLAARGGYGDTILALNEFANDHMVPDAATLAASSSSSSPILQLCALPQDALLFAKNPKTGLTIAHCGCWWVRNPSMLRVMDLLSKADAANVAREQQRKREAQQAAAKAAADALAAQRLKERKAKEEEALAAKKAAEEEFVRRQLADLSAPLKIQGMRAPFMEGEEEEDWSDLFSDYSEGHDDAIVDGADGGENCEPLDHLINVTHGVVSQSQGKAKSLPPLPLDLQSVPLPPVAWGEDVAEAVIDALLPKPYAVALAEAHSLYIHALLPEARAQFEGHAVRSMREFNDYIEYQIAHRSERTANSSTNTNTTTSASLGKQQMDEETATLVELLTLSAESNAATRNERRRLHLLQRQQRHQSEGEGSALAANWKGGATGPLRFALDLIAGGGGGGGQGAPQATNAKATNTSSSAASVIDSSDRLAMFGNAAAVLSKAVDRATVRIHWDAADSNNTVVAAGSSSSSQHLPLTASAFHTIFMPPTVPSVDSVWFQIDHHRFPDHEAMLAREDDYDNNDYGEADDGASSSYYGGGDNYNIAAVSRGGRRSVSSAAHSIASHRTSRSVASTAAAINAVLLLGTPYLESRAAPIHYAKGNHNHHVMPFVPATAQQTVNVLREHHYAQLAMTGLQLALRHASSNQQQQQATVGSNNNIGNALVEINKATSAADSAASVPTQLMVCYSSLAIAEENAARREREEAARRAIFFPQNVKPNMANHTADERELITRLTSDAIAKVYAPPPPPPPLPLLTWPSYYGRKGDGVFKALGLPHMHVAELAATDVLLPSHQHQQHQYDAATGRMGGGGRSGSRLGTSYSSSSVADRAWSSRRVASPPAFLSIDTLLDANIFTSLAFLLCRGDSIIGAAEREGKATAAAKGNKLRSSTPLSAFAQFASITTGRKAISTMLRDLIALIPSVNVPLTASVGTTALMVAAYHGQIKTVSMLLEEFSADVTLTAQLREPSFHGGITALTAATLNGYTAIAEMLLDKGADPNIPDECGNTPLHHAVQTQRIEITKLLLRHGALMSIRNHANHIAEDIAVGLRFKPLMRTLFWWRMAHAVKSGREYPLDVPCDTASAFSDWLSTATTFYKRLDTLREDILTFRNTQENSSVAVICYNRVCQETSTTPMRTIISQLTPYWFPDEVRKLEISGIFLEEATLNTVLTFVKLLPRLEILDFVSCSLTNPLIATICANLAQHPNVRRLNFSLNKHLSKVGAFRIEELLRENTRIIEVEVSNTGLDTATALQLQKAADSNKRALALAYNEYSYSSATKKERLANAIQLSNEMRSLGAGGDVMIDNFVDDGADYYANNAAYTAADSPLGPTAGPSRFVGAVRSNIANASTLSAPAGDNEGAPSSSTASQRLNKSPLVSSSRSRPSGGARGGNGDGVTGPSSVSAVRRSLRSAL